MIIDGDDDDDLEVNPKHIQGGPKK